MRLRQVLHNLVGHAVKYSRKGSVRVLVEPEHKGESGVGVLFSVQGIGVGIIEADPQDLFNVFQRLEGAESVQTPGSGLGLVISRKLVELLDGEIGAESELDQGSRFWFRLAFVRHEHGEAGTAVAEPQQESRPFTGLPVLVVDDNAINRKLLQVLLSRQQVQVTEAEDGREAVEHCLVQSFDLILMDIRMPHMNGMQASRLIHQNERGRRPTPIIALIAHALPEEREQFILSGMDDCIVKPILEPQLLEILACWIPAR